MLERREEGMLSKYVLFNNIHISVFYPKHLVNIYVTVIKYNTVNVIP
jgi:hypothetical protein